VRRRLRREEGRWFGFRTEQTRGRVIIKRFIRLLSRSYSALSARVREPASFFSLFLFLLYKSPRAEQPEQEAREDEPEIKEEERQSQRVLIKIYEPQPHGFLLITPGPYISLPFVCAPRREDTGARIQGIRNEARHREFTRRVPREVRNWTERIYFTCRDWRADAEYIGIIPLYTPSRRLMRVNTVTM